MGKVSVLGVFVADTTYRAERLPNMAETLIGTGFNLGPGGKGSNQAAAASQAGAKVSMLTKLGDDAFGEMAKSTWKSVGVTPHVIVDPDGSTGAAFVFVQDKTAQNAIIISPGVAADISPDDVDVWRKEIQTSDVFMTQLEQPVTAALVGLKMARKAGVTTILNPAPAASLPAEMIGFCDFVTPNEPEAEGLTGIKVTSVDTARRAADEILRQGAGAVIVTLGEMGALFHDAEQSLHLPALKAGQVMDTTGAGDALNGGFAAALAEKIQPLEALRFGIATASIAVTRRGTVPAMPTRAEVEALLNKTR